MFFYKMFSADKFVRDLIAMIEIEWQSSDPLRLIHTLIPSTMGPPFSPLKIIHNPRVHYSLPFLPLLNNQSSYPYPLKNTFPTKVRPSN